MSDTNQYTNGAYDRATKLLLNPKGEDAMHFIQHDLSNLLQEIAQLRSINTKQNLEIQTINKRIEEEKERSNQLFQSAPIACISIDSNNQIYQANVAASKLLHIELTELLGTKINTLLKPKSNHDLEILKHDSLIVLPIAIGSLFFSRKDGDISTIAQITCKQNSTKENPLFRLVLSDNTQQQYEIESLKASKYAYRTIIQQSNDCFLITNETGYITDWNCNLDLFKSKKLTGSSILNFFDTVLENTHINLERDKLHQQLQNFYKTGQADFLNKKQETLTKTGYKLQYTSIALKTLKGFRLAITIQIYTNSNNEELNTTSIDTDSKLQFRSLIEQANIGIFRLSPIGVYNYVSESLTKMIGYSTETIIGKSFIPFIHPDDLQLFKLFIKRVLEKGVKIGGLEYRIKHNNGSWKWHQVSVSPELDEQNRIVSIIGITTDITTRKFTEMAWAESERKFRTLFENMVSGFALLQLTYCRNSTITDSIVVDINPAFERLTMLSRLNVIGQKMISVLPEIGTSLVTKYESIQHEKKSIHFIHYSQKLKKYFDIVLYSASDKHIAAVLNDITKQKNNEKELVKASRELSVIFEHTPSILLLLDDQQKVIKINKIKDQPRIEKQTGTTVTLYSGDILNCVNAWKSNGCGTDEACSSCSLRWVISKCFKEKENQNNMEVSFSIRRNNKVNKLSIIASAVYIPDPESPKVLLSVNDITQEKRIEEALFENEERYRLLSNLTSEGIILSQADIILDFNPAFYNISKWSKADIMQSGFLNRLFNHEVYTHIKEQIDSSEYSTFETDIHTASQELIPVSVTTHSFLFKGQKAQVITLRDIREQREIQKRITKTIITTEEKDRSYFARELHDGLGPLLSTAKIYSKAANGAKDEKRRSFALEKLNETIQESILSVQEISNRLSPHVLDNFGLVAAVQTFYTKIIALNTIDVKLDSTLNKRLDKNSEIMLYRVLVELINNTLKHGKASKININISEENNKTSIQYIDNGVGFDVDSTIKSNHGMGLYNILNRIKTLNGKVFIKSKLSEGVSVDIELPNS